MGADVGALIGDKGHVEAGYHPIGADGGPHPVVLVPAVVGGHHVLPAVLDPLDRAPEPHRGQRHQHVLGVELAPDPEPAAHVALPQDDPAGRHPHHPGQLVAVVERHLGRAQHLQHPGVGVEAGQRPPALQGDAAVAAHRQLQLDHPVRGGQGGLHVADLLGEDHRLGVEAVAEVAGGRRRVQHRVQRVYLDDHLVGRVLGPVGVLGEHRGHRLAHVADPAAGQDGLAVRQHLLEAGLAEPEVDGLDAGHVRRGPHRGHAVGGPGRVGVHRPQEPAGDVGAHHPHVELAGQVDVGGEPPFAPQQRPVLHPPDRLADAGAPAGGSCHGRGFCRGLRAPAGGSCHGRGFAAGRQNPAPVPPTGLGLTNRHNRLWLTD